MCLCDKDTLVVLHKFLTGFYISNKVNFQNYFASELIKWFVFETVQTLAAHVWSCLRHLAIASLLITSLLKSLVIYFF